MSWEWDWEWRWGQVRRRLLWWWPVQSDAPSPDLPAHPRPPEAGDLESVTTETRTHYLRSSVKMTVTSTYRFKRTR